MVPGAVHRAQHRHAVHDPLEGQDADDLQRALKKQAETHLYIGDAIVRVGGFDASMLEPYLAEFKADQAAYATDRVAIPPGTARPELWEMIADLSFKMLTRVARLTFRTAPCRVSDRIGTSHIAVSMDFTGDVRFRYILSVDEGIQTRIAKSMLVQEDVSDEPVEVLDDTVMEFVNVICGNIVAKSVQLGISLDILPPELVDVSSEISIPEEYSALEFPIHLADGNASITLVIYP